MSATLTWYNSGLGTKTGTAIGNLFADIKTLVDSKAGDANFLWEVKGSNTGSTPYYISLGLKSGAAGRIALLAWSSGPAGNNSAILDGAPTANTLYVAWFPAGTGTTLANLAASSGAITGDDTNCVKVSVATAVSSLYAASVQPFYFDSAEAMVFGFNNPASSSVWLIGAGYLIVDAADAVYGCTLGFGTSSAALFGGTTAPLAWTTTANTAGPGSFGGVRTNYGSANRLYYHAFSPSGLWASSAIGANDILTNTGTQDVWFAPVPLLGMTKGEGVVLKYRQIAWGPGTTGAFTVYNTTGPVVAARNFCPVTAGGVGYPWFVNSKI